jgi:hypothetical protein
MGGHMLESIWKTVIDVFYKGLGLLIGIAVAVLVYYLLPSVTGAEKFILSVLGSILSIVVVEFIKQDKSINSIDRKIDRFFETSTTHTGAHGQSIAQVQLEIGVLNSLLADKVRHIEELESILRYGGTSLNIESIDEVWLDLIWRCKEHYFATNYIRPSEIYRTGYAQAALRIQETKIKTRHVSIKKVFILPDTDYDTDEIADINSVLLEQHSAGIEVKTIKRSKIQTHVGLKGKASKLKTIDFGLFDSRFVLLWHLNDNRNIDGGSVLVQQNVDLYRSFFDSLFTEADVFKP